jgi:hypothetical protein
MAFITAPNLNIRSIDWDLDQPGDSNESAWTGTDTTVTNPWHGKWSAKVQLAPILGEANVRSVRSFLARCRGKLNVFRLYATEGPQNANSGVTLSANVAANARSVSITGATTQLKDGQFITINGQLLQVVADQSESLVTFEPMLRAAATAGTIVVTSRPYALVKMTASSNGWGVDAGQQYGISFDVTEAVREADGTVPESALPPPTYSIAAPSAQNEGNSGTTVFTFPVTRSGDTSGTGSVNWAVTGSGGNPANATDFVGGVLPSGTVSFAIGDTVKNITVNVQGDVTVEPDEGFTVTLSSPVNGTITTAAASSTILNDDVAPTAPTSTFTRSELSSNDDHRIFQRTSLTGGAGKGTGTIRIPLSGTGALAGTVAARISSGGGTRGDIQAQWTAATIGAGATFVDVSGVNAGTWWGYVDLLDSTGTWQNGTVLVGMGALFGIAGQSLAQRMIGRRDNANTFASIGITPSPYSRVLASYQDGGLDYLPTVATMPWTQPGDRAEGQPANSTGGGEFLNDMITLLGVNCGLIGHARGGQNLAPFITSATWGNADATRLMTTLSRAGGAWEGFIWGQGHNEAQSQASALAYKSQLDALLLTQIQGANGFSGCKYYVFGVPAVTNNGLGSNFFYNEVNKGGDDWCTARGGTYVHMYDFDMADAYHPTQIGAVTMARHMARATRANYGLSSGLGPKPLSAVRTAAQTIRVTLSDVGQTDLVLVGSPGNRIVVTPTGRVNNPNVVNDNRFLVTAVTKINKTTLDLTLGTDPGNGHDLDVRFYFGNTGGTVTADNIYDDVNPEGFAHGRIVQANFTPLLAAKISESTVNAPPSGFVSPTLAAMNMTETSTTFASGMSGFGQEVTAGSGFTPLLATALPAFTIEGFFTCPAIGTAMTLVAGPSWEFLQVNASGKLQNGLSFLTGATTLTAGHRYHFALVEGPTRKSIYLTDITAAGSGVRDANDTTGLGDLWPANKVIQIRNGGGAPMTGGAVDEVAVWCVEKYSGTTYTAPSVPYAGSEAERAAGLVYLFHCDGNLHEGMSK